jgi:hypothetical protein
METREILLKADKVNVAFERIDGGKRQQGERRIRTHCRRKNPCDDKLLG